MFNISIIGGGQLGSRHLQGLKNINIQTSIYIVDTNPKSLEISKQRFQEGQDNQKIISVNYLTDISELPSHLDLVIIATSSIPRAQITRKLLLEKKVSNIVFEKFLFPSIADYDIVSKELRKYKVKSWVNCPRRMYSYYREVAKILEEALNINYEIIGTNWGMACNSIHFLDIFSMLIKQQSIQIDTSGLNPIIYESKREGFIEINGNIKGKTKDGKHTISITSFVESLEPIITKIETEKYIIYINESLHTMAILDLKAGQEIQKKIQVPFQSQLTAMLAEQILLNGKCSLPTYTESADMHVCFLKPVVDFYNKITGNTGDYCPIT